MKALPLSSTGPSLATSSYQRTAGHRASGVCRACQQQQATAASQVPGHTRRDLVLSIPLLLLASRAQKAAALEAVAAAPDAPSSSVGAADSNSSSSLTSNALELFLDNDYELQVPSSYTFIETPIPQVERGPQPERSPVLARFEAPDGKSGSITVLIRKAQAFKQTLLQVADISQLGDPVSVAKLVLPRGSTLLATATQQVAQPPKQTPLGDVEIPPQTYYTFEFTTNAGQHVAMAVAAKRGSVLICGASTTADRWQEIGPVFGKVVKSFRLRSQPTIS